MRTVFFVTYHSDLSESAILRIYKKFPLFKKQRWAESLPLAKTSIKILFESVRQVYKDCQCIVLSDFSTFFDAMPNIRVIRCAVDPDLPAYSRLCAQIQFLEQISSADIVFLDYDMLLQKSFSDVFQKPFDIGFTYRLTYFGKVCPVPINGGLILIHQEGKAKALAFMQRIRKKYDDKYLNHKEWGGFQAAAADVVGYDTIFSKKSQIVQVHETDVLLLPVDEYNYTILTKQWPVDYMPKKRLLHFKGPRKQAMLNYWKEYLKPR